MIRLWSFRCPLHLYRLLVSGLRTLWMKWIVFFILWLLIVSYQRQTWCGFFDLREEDVTMDVPWCTLVPLLSPKTEWWSYANIWSIIAQNCGSRAAHWDLTCFGSPPPGGLWHQLDAAPLSQTLPTTALLLPPSTGCEFSPHTEQSVQPGLGAA